MPNKLRRWMSKPFVGKMLKQYPTFRKFKKGIMSIEYDATLSEVNNQKFFIIGDHTTSFLGFQDSYIQLDKESLTKLRSYIDDCLERM